MGGSEMDQGSNRQGEEVGKYHTYTQDHFVDSMLICPTDVKDRTSRFSHQSHSYLRTSLHICATQNDMSTKTAADAEDFLAAVRSLLAEMNLESPAMQSDVSVRGKGAAALPPLSTSA